MNRILLIAMFCFLVVSSVSAAPATVTVAVNCNEGDSITQALRRAAVEITLEITGICIEDVEISRNNVTLRGTDPTVDGIQSDPEGPMRQAITLRNVSMISIENLKLTGATMGIGINDSFGVFLTNCRLEDNEFAGAIVGTASGSVWFTDTVVAAPAPPEGARLSRGIWVTNGSNATCNSCTISDYREALLVSTGGQLTVNGGSFTAWRGALDLFANASASVGNAQLDGDIRLYNSSVATLRNTVQDNNGSRNNNIRNGSSLIASGSTLLFGDAWIGEFANVTLYGVSSVSGGLDCFGGGDAYCDNPLAQTEYSNCGQCPNE